MNLADSYSILVAGADLSSQTGLTQFLKDWGYQVRTIGDFQAALASLTTCRTDLLIADLALDGDDRLEFLRQVWQQCPDLPIIVVSDPPLAGRATEALRLGAYDYLVKPIDCDRLQSSLQKALEQAKRLTKSHRLVARLTTANDIWHKLTPLLDVQAISQRFIDELARLIPCDRLAVYLLDPNTGRLIRAASLGLTEEQGCRAEATALERHPGWVVQHRRSLFVPDTRHDTRITYAGSLHQSVCVIHVPLIYEGQVLGVLGVGSNQPYSFDQTDLSLLETLAAQVAVTLENARLHQEMQRRLEALDALQTISAAASANLQPTQVAQMTAQALLQLSLVNLACILLRDPSTGQLRPEATATRKPHSLALFLPELDQAIPLTKASPSWPARVALTKKPLFLPSGQSGLDASLALLPLMVDENLIGVLVAVTTPSQLSPSDRSLLTTIADRIAVTLDSAHLRQAERRRTRELAFLVEALQCLSATLDLEKILQKLVTTLAQYTNVPLCLLALQESKHNCLVVRAVHADWAHATVRVGVSLDLNKLPKLARVLETRTPLLVTDQSLKERIGQELGLGSLQETGINSLVAVPLTHGGQAAGILSLWLREAPAAPPFELMRLANSVAHYAVMAIENTHLYAAMQAERTRAESFYEIERQLVTRLDPDDLVPLVLKVTQQHTQAKWGSLFLFDAAGNTSYYRLAREWLKVQEAQETVQTVIDQGAAGWAVRHRQSCLIINTAEDPRWVRLPDDQMVSIAGSALIVPLIRAGQVVGVLTLVHPDVGHFTPSHQTWLETLASRAAVALENAQLYERVKSEQQQLDTVLRSTADAVIVIDHEGRLTMANPAAERLFGIALSDVHGQSLARLLVHSKIKGDLKSLLRHRTLRPFTFSLQVGERTVRGHAAPIKGPSQESSGWVTILQDITDLKELDRLKSQMIQMASHDLRNPLNLAYNYQMLLNETIAQPTDEQREMLDGLRRNLMRMEDLISNILDLERIEAGIGRRIEPFDWEKLVQEVVEELVDKPTHAIALDTPTDLPTVWGDRVQLRQALTNLIDNAVKYTPPGGHITIRSRHKGKELQVEVEDDGLGIPADRLPNLFQHFYRAKQPGTESIGGTGLGLSLVKAIVEGHSGRIWVQSQENQGSTFGFALPLNHNSSPG